MNELSLMTGIVGRAKLPELLAILKERNVQVNLIALGRGTAANDVMDMLGMESPEKAVCFSIVTGDAWKAVKRDLRQKLQIDVPGVGIAFRIPMASIGGKRELMFLTDGQGFARGEEESMKNTERELLLVISNEGYNELVMDAARSAGARGGTIIHARGTGMKQAERFFGVSLASEKDVLFIVTRTEEKNQIMKAIMEKAGVDSPAGSIVFSLPVTDTAGLTLTDAYAKEEEAKKREEAAAVQTDGETDAGPEA